MSDGAWLAGLAGTLAILTVLSIAVERLLQPAPRLRGRPAAAWSLHLGTVLLAFSIALALLQRPWFAAAIVLAMLLVVVFVSNAKSQALREPFVFPDFEYFTDTLRHPRLYLPYLGWWRLLLATAAFLAAAGAGFALEPSLAVASGRRAFIVCVGALALAAVTLLVAGARRIGPASFDPAKDMQQAGLLASLWTYGLAERIVPDFAGVPSPFATAPRATAEPLPDIVVVQGESFFDARRLFAGIDGNVLKHWDEAVRSAASHGRLAVDAWGANTVRTEFAFLSGLAAGTLGVHRFNPYRKLARAGLPTVATFLRGLGYRTVCVHPYPASFYNRRVVFPALGFDEFVDVASFREAERVGPYVGDVAVARKVSEIVAAAAAPIFVFAITMENHGPLHWERLAEGERARPFTAPPPGNCDDLAVYLRHLANADRMLGMLREQLAASRRPGWLCFYGDHVPIMPEVYAALGEPDGRTDFMIWGNRPPAGAQEATELGVSRLGQALLEAAGLLEPARA